MGWRASTGWVPLTFLSAAVMAPMLGQERQGPSENTGEVRPVQLPMMAVASPDWWTGSKPAGLASDSAPQSVSGSLVPSVV